MFIMGRLKNTVQLNVIIFSILERIDDACRTQDGSDGSGRVRIVGQIRMWTVRHVTYGAGQAVELLFWISVVPLYVKFEQRIPGIVATGGIVATLSF